MPTEVSLSSLPIVLDPFRQRMNDEDGNGDEGGYGSGSGGGRTWRKKKRLLWGKRGGREGRTEIEGEESSDRKGSEKSMRKGQRTIDKRSQWNR